MKTLQPKYGKSCVSTKCAWHSLVIVTLTGLMSSCATPTSHKLAAPIHVEGIWKAAVPARAMDGEFGNLDPMGLIADAQIHCDCSINWLDPDTGKRYCFVSGTSLVYFLQEPQMHIGQAALAWGTVRR